MVIEKVIYDDDEKDSVFNAIGYNSFRNKRSVNYNHDHFSDDFIFNKDEIGYIETAKLK